MTFLPLFIFLSCDCQPYPTVYMFVLCTVVRVYVFNLAPVPQKRSKANRDAIEFIFASYRLLCLRGSP